MALELSVLLSTQDGSDTGCPLAVGRVGRMGPRCKTKYCLSQSHMFNGNRTIQGYMPYDNIAGSLDPRLLANRNW